MTKLARFSNACAARCEELADYLTELLDELADHEDIGIQPYHVPKSLIDPRSVHTMDPASFLISFFRTGDLLLDPVLPDNAPDSHTFVNEDSREWFEDQEIWPTGFFKSTNTHFFTVDEVASAVAEWVCKFSSYFLGLVLSYLIFRFQGRTSFPSLAQVPQAQVPQQKPQKAVAMQSK